MIKPWHNEKLISTINEALKKKDSNRAASSPISKITKAATGASLIIGESEPMKDIFLKVDKIAPTDANVLILGENGTGKDLVATAIHQQSLRANKPLNSPLLHLLKKG